MTRRDPEASRPSSSSRAGGSRTTGKAGGRAGAQSRNGKVNVNCPQCGTQYRIAEDDLDGKIECQECHRVFFAKTAVGKRPKVQDNSKTYLIFGGVAVFVVAIFIAMSRSGGSSGPRPAEPPRVQKDVITVSNHPRTQQLVTWAQAIANDNRLVLQTHNDVASLAKMVEVDGSDSQKLFEAIQKHDSTRYLRELLCESGRLADEASMTAATGRGTVFVTPKPGTDDYRKNTRGEIEVSFRVEGEQIKVTSWTVTMKPLRNPNKPDPSTLVYVPNKDIAKPEEKEISDSAGTRKVKESKPTPVPHWEKATPEQQKMADEIVAQVIASASHDAPGGLFARATLRVKTDEDRKAVVPRVLNAMHDLVGDVTANNLKLSNLNRALVTFTGYAVNYQVEDTSDAKKDKAERESCVRQWFAFWYRYSNDLGEFFDSRENLEEPLEPKGPPKQPQKK